MNENHDTIILKKLIGKDVKPDPQVSVIIPAHNLAPYIVETLDSVFAQTFTNFEVILVNDGSTDTLEFEQLLQPYLDKLIYISQENAGASVARNTAINNSSGKYLAFLDGDDIWLPENLASQIKFIENNSLEMIYCDAWLFGEIYYKEATYRQKSPSEGPVTTESLLLGHCNVITSGTVVLREKVIESGLFDKMLPRNQDFDLWFRLAKNGVKIGYQTEILLKYRVRLNSLSGSNLQRAERNVVALKRIKEKYDLTESEQKVWNDQMEFSIAEFELEKGKYHLLREEFEESLVHFKKSNNYYKKFKLTVIINLVKFSPRLLVKLFKKIRSDEISFIAPTHS